MKHLIFFIFFLHSSMSFAEIKRFYPEGKIRYASTLVDDLGKNYDNTRPGVIFDLHFTYLLNKNFALRSLNYIVPYDDTNNDGTTQNYEFNQRLGLIIKEKNFTLIPYGKIVYHDKNGPKQNDNSHFGIVGQVEIAKDLTFSYDYREENTNGAKLAGTVYGDIVTDMRLVKKNVLFINSMPVHFKLGQADGKNFRRSTVVKATMDITKKIDLSIKHVDNQGKGLFKNNVTQNRNYLVMDIGYKF